MASPKSKIKKIHILLKEQMEDISMSDIDDHYYVCLRTCEGTKRENWMVYPLNIEPICTLQNIVSILEEHQEYLFLYIEFEGDTKNTTSCTCR